MALKETQRTETTYSEYSLRGNKTLLVLRHTRVYHVVYENLQTGHQRIYIKELLSEVSKKVAFHLKEISSGELTERRKNNIPSFVLKKDGKLFHSEIDPVMYPGSTILSPWNAHLCAETGHECAHLSAASDEDGGCKKVRQFSTGIERYPWITDGYETFSTLHDVFVVWKCGHYKACPPRKKYSQQDIMKMKMGLAQYMWDDAPLKDDPYSRMKVRRRIGENISKGGANTFE